MPIETVAIIGKGAVGLLHGSKIAKAVGSKHLEYVMDDERYLRHRTDRIVIKTSLPSPPAKQNPSTWLSLPSRQPDSTRQSIVWKAWWDPKRASSRCSTE